MNTLAMRGTSGAGDEPTSDCDLLARVVGQDDEAALSLLVARYCGLVLGVCRRVLRDEHDAEDAFQATFLVLVRRAARIQKHEALAGWLHAVAYRTAVRASRRRYQRPHEPLPDDLRAVDDVFTEIARRHEQRLLDDELRRLPPHYRDPLVLRYFLGKTSSQIALELGVSAGVVEGRLKRGKESLRVRLTRRGIGIGTILAAAGFAQRASAATMSGSLIGATARAATGFRAGVGAEGICPQRVVELAEMERAMSTSTSVAITSGAASAVLLTVLALGWAGERGTQPSARSVPPLAAAAPTEAPIAGSTEAVRLAADQPDPFAAPTGSGSSIGPAASEKKGAAPKHGLPAEQAIAEALEMPTQIEFIETPLTDVVDYLKDLHQIEIQLDHKALDEVGIAADTPMTLNLKGVSLRSALRLMLRNLDLTYTIANEVLLITTPEAAKQMPVTRIYPVADLAEGNEGDTAWLSEAILRLRPQGAIQPESVTEAKLGGQTVLIVSEAYTLHEDIERLLRDLRRVAETPGVSPDANSLSP